jgi:hypothetical protein
LSGKETQTNDRKNRRASSPDVEILRILLVMESTKNTTPSEETTTPLGLFNPAAVPTPSTQVAAPEPARVLTMPNPQLKQNRTLTIRSNTSA